MRSERGSRNQTVREIVRRASSEGRWPPVCIFPEGKFLILVSCSSIFISDKTKSQNLLYCLTITVVNECRTYRSKSRALTEAA